MKITILGCGSSAGVPMIGCRCAVCTSPNPKNRRTRASILVEKGDTVLLVDVSPDLRQQALACNITQVDAIMFTHAHADHCHGIDDLRSFNYHKNQLISVYSDSETLSEIARRFDYAFKPPTPEYGWFRPALEPQIIEVNPYNPVIISHDLKIIPFLQHHGKHGTTIGIRIDDFVYSTDVNRFPEESLQALENIECWVVDCLRYDPAPTHAHLDLTLSWIEQFKPKRAVLTHLGHEMEYEALNTQTPPHVEAAYDGMVITL